MDVELCEVMAELAAGDRAAIVRLYAGFGGRIAHTVRRHLRRFGVARPSSGDVDDLVMDVCFMLAGCAAGWDPDGGALPWTWADARVRTVVGKWLGVFADPLDPADLAAMADDGLVRSAGSEVAADVALQGLASAGGPAALLLEAFGAARVSDRDRAMLLEYTVQQDLGDPSPAHTVGAQYGLAPPAVRQAVGRARDRLARVTASDGRFRELAGLPVLRP
jgi:hypothetical protein